jgi:hypothetical protein
MVLCGPLALIIVLWMAKRCGGLNLPFEHVTAVIWIVSAILFQPTITKQMFALIPTIQVDGTHYLANDMSVAVGSPEYGSAIAVAAIAIVVFVVGIPVAVLRVLRNPNHRSAPAFAFMFGSFVTEKRWWSVVVVWRKTAITAAVSVLTEPWQQLYIATWIMALSLVWHVLVLPYKSPSLNTLETKMLSSATFIMAFSLAIPIGFGHSTSEMMEVVIGGANLGTLAWLVQVALKRVTAEDLKKMKTVLAETCHRCRKKRANSSEVLDEPLLHFVANE